MSKALGEGKILFIPLAIPDHKYLTNHEQKEGTIFGSSMVDVFADVPEAYTRNNMHPDLRKRLNTVADETVKFLGLVTTIVDEDNKFVELSLMKKNDEHLLVNLVNYNVTIDGDITPAKNVKAQIAIPKGHSVKNITYSGKLGEMQKLNYDMEERNGGTVANVTFPGLNVYGLAKVELE